MKRVRFCFYLLWGLPLLAGAQDLSSKYPPLRAMTQQQFEEVERGVNARGGEEERNKAYLFYLGLSVYEPRPAAPDSLFASAPWEKEEETGRFDIEQAAQAVKPFMDSLTIHLPSDRPQVFYMMSMFEPERWKNRSRDELTPELEVFRPENERMNGALTAPVSWLNGARLRMTYNFSQYAEEEKSILLTRTEGSLNEATEDGTHVLQGIGLGVSASDFRDIDMGMLTVEAIPPFKTYEVVKLDSSSVGKKYTFAGVDFTVTAFAPGMVHWKTDSFEEMQRLYRQIKIWMSAGGKGYQSNFQLLNGGGFDFYHLALQKPGLTQEAFEPEYAVVSKKNQLAGAQVWRIKGMYDFDCIYFYRENTPLLGSRHMLVSKSKNYVPTYFVKNSEGVSSAVDFTAGSEYTLSEFIGGSLAMTLFFHRQMIYPAEALEAGRSGHALVEATVTPEGQVENPRLISEADDEFAEEALRLVKLSSGKWKPASKDGKPIEERRVVAVTFDVATYKMFRDQE